MRERNDCLGLGLFSMEHLMRTVMRSIALVFLLIGLGSGPLAAQANPPPAPAYPPPPANAPPPPDAGPPGAAQQSQHYAPGEIVDAGHRFFGSVSRGLAQIVEKAGSQWGLPNGY